MVINAVRKNIFVVMIFIIIIFLVLFCFYNTNKIAVFTYHKIVPKEIKEKYYKDNKWVDTTEHFEQQMNYLYMHNYNTISMKEYSDWRKSKKRFNSKTVLLTIDDGDIGVYYEILPILKKYNFKATCFIIGEHINNISEQYDPIKQQFLGKDLIEKINKEYPNLELQSHSFGLHKTNINMLPIVDEFSIMEINNDFEKMEEFNFQFSVFSYPYGSFNKNVIEILNDKNYEMAFLLNNSELSSKKDNKYMIPRIGINYETSFENFKKWLIKEIIF